MRELSTPSERSFPALARSLASPTAAVWLMGLFQLALWGIASGVLAVAPPDDSLEQVLLSQNFRVEYGKHPPMPTWILYAVNRLVGPSIGVTYVLGAACAVATMLLLYAFARPLIGDRRAALAAVLLSNVEYLNAGTSYFNHNTVQLPLALLAIMGFHRALTRLRWHDWALFGLACGLMMLTKYSAVILFTSFGLYLLWSGRWRDAIVCRGVGVALLVAAVLFAPYYLAVRSDPWSPNAYAANSIFPGNVGRFEALKSVWGFASSQFAKVVPALLIFALVRRGAPRVAEAPGAAVPLGPFLTIVSFGPVVLTVVVAALSGAFLLVGWGTTFHVLLTFWLVAARPFAIDVKPQGLRTAVGASIVLQGVLWALVTTHGGRLPNLNPTPHPVAAPTPARLGDAVRSAWALHCAAPLRYVVADGVHLAAALAVGYRGQPRVLDATREEFSKFFTEDVRIKEGALVVTRRASGAAATASAAPTTAPQHSIERLLADSAWQTTVTLPASDGQQVEYTLGLLTPSTGSGCEYAK